MPASDKHMPQLKRSRVMECVLTRQALLHTCGVACMPDNSLLHAVCRCTLAACKVLGASWVALQLETART